MSSMCPLFIDVHSPPSLSLSLSLRKVEEHVADSLLEQPAKDTPSPQRTVSEPGGKEECVYTVYLIVLVITKLCLWIKVVLKYQV